jgi:hypothetical protein
LILHSINPEVYLFIWYVKFKQNVPFDLLKGWLVQTPVLWDLRVTARTNLWVLRTDRSALADLPTAPRLCLRQILAGRASFWGDCRIKEATV